ncbi:hypothetical protein CN514_25200, partial [Bacillus sp. AFS001701]
PSRGLGGADLPHLHTQGGRRGAGRLGADVELVTRGDHEGRGHVHQDRRGALQLHRHSTVRCDDDARPVAVGTHAAGMRRAVRPSA